MRVWKRTKYYSYEFMFEGRRIRRSSKQADKEAAKNIASTHLTRLAEGRVGLIKPKRFTIGELADRVEKNYGIRKKMSAQNASLLKRLRADFGTRMAHELTSDELTAYAEAKLAKGYAPATVDRTMRLLKRAYRLGKVEAPDITLMNRPNARQGFFTRPELDRLLASLPDEDLKDFCLFAYLTGMRLGEIRALRWADVLDNQIRLRGADAKTGKPRSLAIAGPLIGLMDRRHAARAIKTGEGVTMAGTIFHRYGEPVGEFKKSWSAACTAAGLGKMICPRCKREGAARWCEQCKTQTKYRGRIFHDFRRTGVRNLIRAGVPQSVAMQISGHTTVSVFKRYDIVDHSDVVDAMKKLEAYDRAAQA